MLSIPANLKEPDFLISDAAMPIKASTTAFASLVFSLHLSATDWNTPVWVRAPAFIAFFMAFMALGAGAAAAFFFIAFFIAFIALGAGAAAAFFFIAFFMAFMAFGTGAAAFFFIAFFMAFIALGAGAAAAFFFIAFFMPM